MHKWKKAGILLSLLSVAEAGSSAYFYKRTMKRGMASTERTMKMAGTDWSQYEDLLKERKEKFLARPREDVSIRSRDGLRLRGTYIPNGDEKKIVMENLIGMKRAGADMIITYHALDVAEWIQKGEV